MKKNSGTFIWLVTIIILSLAFIFFLNSNSNSMSNVSYSDFVKSWDNDIIESITIDDGKITGVTKDKKMFRTYIPMGELQGIINEHHNSDVVIDFIQPAKSNMWVSIAMSVGVILLVIFIFTILQHSQSSGGGSSRGVTNFGKNKAVMISSDEQSITFRDVAGLDEEKGELEEVVNFLKKPNKYIRMGARIPKGMLLVGPPGTGKTLLAKAIAGEAKVPFFIISGSDFVEMFVGVGASRVRSLFEEAKKNSPCIVFIDEIDAVGRQRGTGLGGSHDEREQTLNQLLVAMDGFGVNEGIIVIAATNRPDILDPALLRPGRFDRQIIVGQPDVKGREEILKVHVRNKLISDDIDLNVLSKMIPGFSGADIENLTNEAALLAVRKNHKEICMEDIEEAITKVIAGPEKKSRIITDKDKKLTAYHEAGHAVVMKVLPNCDPVHEISIIPRGRAGGYTMHLPKEDTTYVSKSRLLDEIAALLGGRVAEKLIIGDISTGAKNDIDRATSIAKSMVMEYGMSSEIGTISYSNESDGVFLGRDLGRGRNFSEEVGAKIDLEIKKIIDTSYSRAKNILNENMDKLHAVANALIDKEKLNANEFEEIFVRN